MTATPKGMLTRESVNLATAGIKMMVFVHPLRVDELGALLLAQADGDHLHQARFDRAAKIGVRLDAHDQDPASAP